MNRHLLPAVEERLRLHSHAECALTLAVLELSATGFGVAWVPQSVAGPRLAAGDLAALDDRLPSVGLRVLASRLAGPHSPIEQQVWAIAEARAGAASRPAPARA
jgi:DNA-binding transcriptional LysR family regulator